LLFRRDLSYNHLGAWTFVLGQPPTPWDDWGQLTYVSGLGRLSSPTDVSFEMNAWYPRGRDSTWDSIGGLEPFTGEGTLTVLLSGVDKNGTIPGIGGMYPINDQNNSYADKIPSTCKNYPEDSPGLFIPTEFTDHPDAPKLLALSAGSGAPCPVAVETFIPYWPTPSPIDVNAGDTRRLLSAADEEEVVCTCVSNPETGRLQGTDEFGMACECP